jgi:hypothetical protein
VSWETDDPDILTGMDFDGLMAWVHDYCKANPLAKVTTGAGLPRSSGPVGMLV